MVRVEPSQFATARRGCRLPFIRLLAGRSVVVCHCGWRDLLRRRRTGRRSCHVMSCHVERRVNANNFFSVGCVSYHASASGTVYSESRHEDGSALHCGTAFALASGRSLACERAKVKSFILSFFHSHTTVKASGEAIALYASQQRVDGISQPREGRSGGGVRAGGERDRRPSTARRRRGRRAERGRGGEWSGGAGCGSSLTVRVGLSRTGGTGQRWLTKLRWRCDWRCMRRTGREQMLTSFVALVEGGSGARHGGWH